MSAELRPEEFDQFFHALHGQSPFPWQGRLAQTVFAKGWPAALDVPTGGGKTAVIDIAVFHLALEATRGPDRSAGARILFLVDRRLIVDDAFGRARAIAGKLRAATSGILGRVADRLRRLAEDGTAPIAVARLRGGAPKEPDWVRTPAQPTIIVSTIDQVGSRLLFRGYGVSDSMKPIHAGLLGADALLLLDEAHLSQPFVQTVRDLEMFRAAPWSDEIVKAPFHVVTLSATHSGAESTPQNLFEITSEDRGHPELGKRLAAKKPAELIEAKSKSSEAAFAEAFADRAWSLSVAAGGAGQVVAVVVNRVKRARAVFSALRSKAGARDGDDPFAPEVILLIGRTREVDRNDILREFLPFLRAGEGRQTRERPLFVVATQCVEAGADLDFDALVTEIAPLDCLRQRFGRLNRMGRDIDARAAVIAAADQIAKTAKADLIYGEAPRRTWELLIQKSTAPGRHKDRRSIDFGIERSASWLPKGEALDELVAPRRDAPVLMPSSLGLWSRTSPVPAVDPEISLYLHGPEAGPADVEIVWRADLDDDNRDFWRERVRVCPPSTLESISVPIAEARAWLRGKAFADIADVEGARGGDEEGRDTRGGSALRWRGADNSEVIGPTELRPGDMIVVPASRGGCDRWGWAPASDAPIRDLGREANLQQHGRDILRLTRASPELALTADNEIAFAAGMKEWRSAEIVEKVLPLARRSPRVLRAGDGMPLAIEQSWQRSGQEQPAASVGEAVTEDDDSVRAFRQRPVLLRMHSRGVETYARRFAEQAGLASNVVADVALASYLHDAGKAHPDFKRFLYGGDELAAIAAPDLAKSTKLPDGPEAWDEVRRRAGLPKGARHEVASLRFAEAHPRFGEAHDPELVLWLIGTHHGYGRPFFPAPERDWPGEGATFETDLGDGRIAARPARSLADLTAAWLDLFERLKRRYGPWGLARLEAVLRLADHRRSEAEQEDEP